MYDAMHSINDSLQIALLIWVNRVNTKTFIEWMRPTLCVVCIVLSVWNMWICVCVCKIIVEQQLNSQQQKHIIIWNWNIILQWVRLARLSFTIDLKSYCEIFIGWLLNMEKSNDLWLTIGFSMRIRTIQRIYRVT